MLEIHPVRSWDEFRQCLDLRYAIYAGLGYISRARGNDFDAFDANSIHFLASDAGQAAATVRLILAGDISGVGELELSREWSERFKEAHAIDLPDSGSMPIFDTLQDNPQAAISPRLQRPSELSRIIVAPNWRGQGLALRLCETVIQKATELSRDAIFLECLPATVGLFEQAGFKVDFQALRYRHLNVPERVVAMRMQLSQNSPAESGR